MTIGIGIWGMSDHSINKLLPSILKNKEFQFKGFLSRKSSNKFINIPALAHAIIVKSPAAIPIFVSFIHAPKSCLKVLYKNYFFKYCMKLTF